jgi:hypothetical protein
MDWTIPMMIPSTSGIIRLKPFLNKHHEHVIKFSSTNDYIGLVQYFKELLQQLCVENINISDLPVIDQVVLLLRLRTVCIGPSCTLIIPKVDSDDNEKKSDEKDETDPDDSPDGKSYSVSLVDIQRDIMTNYIQPITIGNMDDVLVTVHYPTCWTKPTIKNYLSTVVIGNNNIDLKTLNDQQIDQLIDNFPVDILNKINKSIKRLDNNINERIYIKTVDSEPDIYLNHEIYIDILSVLYGEPLENFLEQIYVFVKFINMTMNDIMNLSPVDTQMYYALFEKENKTREAANKQQTNS